MKRKSNKNLPGNEVYYTNSLVLLVKNMLCSKLHYQKYFELIVFLYKIGRDLKATVAPCAEGCYHAHPRLAPLE